MVLREQMVLRELLVQVAKREHLERTEALELQVNQVQVEQTAHQGLLQLQVVRVLAVLQEQAEKLEHLERTEALVQVPHLVLQEHQVALVLQVRAVQMV